MTDEAKVTVVIPTKNGGELFKDVLTKVLSQECGFKFQVLLVDSGSKDGTVEYIQQISSTDPRVSLEVIPPQDFGHGKTRNYAVSLTTSPFVAFLTQDALPANNYWLVNLINGFKDDEIAGVFGKHIPYNDAFPVEKQAILDHFDIGFGKEFLKVKLEDKEDFEKRKGWYIFYSDNNSCLRRSVWEKIKLPEVEMAEDQKWAEQILLAGFAKAYAPDAIIFHSHKYGFGQIIKRYFDEYKFHVQVGNLKKASIMDAIKFYFNGYKTSLRVVWKSQMDLIQKVYWSYFYIVYDIARTYGFYIGTNYHKVNDKTYSMQEEIKKS